MLNYKGTMVRVEVELQQKPRADPAAVEQAVRGFVKAEFPHVETIVVTIPEERSELPWWWPGNCPTREGRGEAEPRK